MKCFKDENLVPIHFRKQETNTLTKMSSSENIETGSGHASAVSISGNKQHTESLSSIGKKSGGVQNQRYTSSFYSKSNKFGTDDAALAIMKNILQNNIQNEANKQGNFIKKIITVKMSRINNFFIKMIPTFSQVNLIHQTI